MPRYIDFHVHPPTAEYLDGAFEPFTAALEGVFGRTFPRVPIDEVAELYRADDGMAVLLGWDAETASGLPPVTSTDIAAMVADREDVFIGFGAVDPHKPDAVSEVERTADLGLRGLKLHPSAQHFSPADPAFLPVFERASELGLICLFHTGYTGLGAGMRGGGGVVIHYANPMHLDALAAHVPDLQIVAAHPSWPWQDEAIAVAKHKPNVWLELSGWSPRRIEPKLIEAVRRQFAARTLFGTDYPFITPELWIAARSSLEPAPDPALTRQVLHDNAARLLGL
jgi:predicted TIM-barrel fold metal-dependent hydrolase